MLASVQGAMGKTGKKKTPRRTSGGGGDEMLELSISSKEIPKLMAENKASNRIVICKWSGCYDMATLQEFCRLHYLSNWRKLKAKEAKRKGQGLKDYLKELTGRFPEEYFDKLKAEIEELGAAAAESDSTEDASERSFFDPEDSDDDMDTIIKGIKVEDY